MIFELNGKDYTKYLQDDSYNVVAVDIGESWTDANYKQHINQIFKVQGSFKIAFVKDSDYTTFLNDIERAKNADGFVVCTLHVINLNTTKQIECILTISPDRFRPVDNTKVVNILNIGINEA